MQLNKQSEFTSVTQVNALALTKLDGVRKRSGYWYI